MNYKLDGRDILFNDSQLGPYPDHLLKRVDVPTNSLQAGNPRRKAQSEAAKSNKPPDIKNPAPGRTEPVFQSILGVRQYLKAVTENPNPVASKKAPIPDDPRVRSRHLKCFGYFLGLDMIGICKIPEYAMYLDGPDKQPIGCDYKYAIILVLRKPRATCAASNGYDWIFNSCSHVVYSQLMLHSEEMATYIRKLGFEAIGSNIRNYYTVMPSLLMAAGIGESGRLGLCVNPFFGPNFKSAAVLTNMELEPDKPVDFGLQEYCKTCGICAQVCISGALSKTNELIEYNGYQKYKIEYQKCAELSSNLKTGGVCGRCANMCPWNRPDCGPEFYKDWDGDMQMIYDSVNARAAYLRERKFITDEYRTDRWWFDLCNDAERNLSIPKNSRYTVY